MRCFNKYIKSLENNKELKQKGKSEIKSIDDLEITVHCQITIFKWLIDYITNQTINCDLNIKNVHLILMSSDYLDMPKLTNICIEFIVDNIKEILNQKEAIPTYKSHIAKSIARKFCEKKYESVLDSLVDEKDVILSRLYKKKLELYFENSRNLLYKCALCSELFTDTQKEVFICPTNSHKFIGSHGEIKSYHQADSSWDLNDYVMQYRDNKMAWKEIYWKMWARTKIFKCRNCNQYFIPIDTKNSCRSHTQEIKSNLKNNTGVYQCCNSMIQKFDVGISIEDRLQSNSVVTTPRQDDLEKTQTLNGCSVCDHVVDAENLDSFLPDNQLNISSKTQLIESLKEDLEYYWRNIELICKESKMPEIKSSAKTFHFEFDGSEDESDEPFSEIKSRYIKEKSNKFNTDDNMQSQQSENSSTQTKVQSQKICDKAKIITWRKDALRYDDKDSMKSLINNLKLKRDMQKKG